MLLLGCLKETAFLSEEASNYVYEIAYEEETNSFQEIPEGKTHETASIMQQLASVPVVERKKIHIGILADGSSEWEITQITPKNNFDLPESNLTSKATYRTVLRNNRAYYFDKSGKLLYSDNFTTPDFSDFLLRLKNQSNKSNFKSAFSDSTTEMTYLNDSIVEYRKLITTADDYQNPDYLGRTYADIVNIKQQLILTEAIYDADNKLIYLKNNSYDKKREFPLPVFSKITMEVENSVGEISIYNSIIQCNNINISNNLD